MQGGAHHVSDWAVPCPLDRVRRQFQAPRPSALLVADFTYVATWQGFVYVAFVIDTVACRIVCWRVSRTAHAGFVLDALERAVHDRRPAKGSGLIHHSDRRSQYVAVKYTERLTDAGVEPSVGSVGDSYDNALAETINGFYKTGVIRRRGAGLHLGRWATRSGQGKEDVFPYAFGRPMGKAVVERHAGAVNRQSIRPSPARFRKWKFR